MSDVTPTSRGRHGLLRYLPHAPLTGVAVLSAVGAGVALVLWAVDPRELLGVSVWEKPLKFLVSTVAYALTFSWFYSLVTRAKRAVWRVGTLIAGMLALELAIIIALASFGWTSHFNVQTPFHITMWSLMAAGITTLWVASFVLAAFLWNSPLVERTTLLAIRWSLGIGLAGMGIAFTMTPPQPGQLADFQGIAGAHTVGAPDGGPGVPFLGWSLIAGDLRIAHFVGLHALQVFPLLAAFFLSLGLGERVRRALIHGAGVTYSALTAVVYVQALRGESIVSTSPLILTLFALSLVAGAVTVAWTVSRPARVGAPR